MSYLSVVEACRTSGNAFQYEVTNLVQTGSLPATDPRATLKFYSSAFPRSSNECLKLAGKAHPNKTKHTISLQGKAPKDDKIGLSVSLKFELARHLEDLVMQSPDPTAEELNPTLAAVLAICDSAVLERRHRDGHTSAAKMMMKGALHHQDVLRGMVLWGAIKPHDYRVICMNDGVISEYLDLRPADFYSRSAAVVNKATKEIVISETTSEQKTEIADMQSMYAKALDYSDRHERESGKLSALSAWAERLGDAFAYPEPDRARELAGISMAAARRASAHYIAFKNSQNTEEKAD